MKKLEIIKTYYDNNMSKDLPEYGILGWESAKAQRLRFDVLLSSVDLAGRKLLDVGCGTGNLLEYIDSKGIKVDYTGVDILEKMIAIAESKKLNGVFKYMDIFKNNIFGSNSFDVVYTSGIFNLDLGNNREFLKNALELFMEISRDAVVFNLLHVDSPDREDKYFYFHPDEVRDILALFADRIARAEFVEAYLKNDFTVVVRKL
ncbi:MAG: class I SAM-dependent methyltransferase [Clostridiaceae bacterium]|nr:class I SAM-dependent methyltransferase [Clostridiaceae bacterium]